MLHSKNKRVIKRSLITGGFVGRLWGLTHHVVSVGALADGSKHSNGRNGLSGQPAALFWHSEAAERKKFSLQTHICAIMDHRYEKSSGLWEKGTFEAGDVTAAVFTVRGQRFRWPRWVETCWGGTDVEEAADGTTSPTNERTVLRGHPTTAPMHKWEGAITYFQGSPNQFLSEGIFP